MDMSSYLAELDKELKGLNDEDKQNVLAYYNEYLIDAEAEAEGQFDAAAILGTPHTLAAQIRADIAMAPLAQESATTVSQGIGHQQAPSGQMPSPYQQAPIAAGEQQVPFVQNTGAYQQGQAAPGYQPSQPYQQQAPGGQMPSPQQGQPQGKKKKSDIGIVWAVILGILAIPVGIPLAIALFALIFAVLITLFSLLISLGAVALGLFVTGIIAVIVGFFFLFVSPPVGVFYIGSGLVVLGFFILLAIAFWVLGRLAIRGVAKLFNAIRVKLTRRERVTQ